MTESQRGRILTAMVEVTAERGYADCRIADVIAYAGVSRKTFYELFSDKEECFLAAYDLWLGRLFATTAEAFDSELRTPTGASGFGWRSRTSSSSSPSTRRRPASASSRCSPPGPKALARRDAGVRQFTHFIDAGRAETSVQLPGITALAIVGGIHELLYSEIIHGATAQLPNRLPELVFWIVQPFLGPERAIAERDRARAMLAERPGPRRARAASLSARAAAPAAGGRASGQRLEIIRATVSSSSSSSSLTPSGSVWQTARQPAPPEIGTQAALRAAAERAIGPGLVERLAVVVADPDRLAGLDRGHRRRPRRELAARPPALRVEARPRSPATASGSTSVRSRATATAVTSGASNCSAISSTAEERTRSGSSSTIRSSANRASACSESSRMRSSASWRWRSVTSRSV